MSESPANEQRPAAKTELTTAADSDGAGPLPEIPGYRLLELLGEGAMGSVFLAVEESLERRVALKILTEDFSTRDGAREQFEREARTMATVEHPHVVRVYAFGRAGGDDPQPYLAMEYVEGATLEQRIEREGRLERVESLRILTEMTQALRAAWRRRIVHRDVKPGNVLLDQEGRVRVGDFGIAKPLELGDGALTAGGVSLGTPRYTSPEQASGEGLDFRSDIYSLGIVLWEMLVGRPPFADSNALVLLKRHLTEELPRLADVGVEEPALEHLIARMTAKDREARFSSYDELLEAIAALHTNPETAAAPATSVPETAQWFYARGRDKVGPLAREEIEARLAAGDLGPKTYVWGPGFEKWERAEGVPDLGAVPAASSEVLGLLSAQAQTRSVFDEMRHIEVPSPHASPAVEETQRGNAAQAPPTSAVPRPQPPSPVARPTPAAQPPEAAKPPAKPTATPSPPSTLAPALPAPRAPAPASMPATSRLVLWDSGPSPHTRTPETRLPGSSGKPATASSSGLDDVLDEVDARLGARRETRLRRSIEHSSTRARFDELKQQIVKPALRGVMARLHDKGHPTKLQDVNQDTIRLEFVLHSSARCAIEVALAPQARLAFRFQQNLGHVSEDLVPLDRIDAGTIEQKIAGLLRRGLNVR